MCQTPFERQQKLATLCADMLRVSDCYADRALLSKRAFVTWNLRSLEYRRMAHQVFLVMHNYEYAIPDALVGRLGTAAQIQTQLC